jgi:transposase
MENRSGTLMNAFLPEPFSSDAGGARAAATYGLLGTAKLNGLNPEAYLREVLPRIADHPIKRIDELLPWNLAAGLAGNSRHTA